VSLFGGSVEFRNSRRYRVLAPVTFLWGRSDGLLQESKGTIRDISDRGVFIIGDVVPRPGVHLDLEVYLPSLGQAGGAVQLHGEGTVVRVDRGDGILTGFAAAVAFQTEAASGPPVADPGRLH
jgi:PilZ domain